jgi:iron complex outermembrane recepter protein
MRATPSSSFSWQPWSATHLGRTGAALACGLLASSGALAQAAAQTQGAGAPAEGGGLQEVVVTATRHEESLSKVAISVTALTQDAMNIRGVKDFLDVARFTPGVNVDNSGTNNIAIRGIASSGGAGTTGIYIDDTPIQMRALAFNPDEALPKSFDIDRVEVLRGPQGTLFGAGSEGGTVRYITTPPSLTQNSLYSRGELAFTQGGDPSYELGMAAGGPLVDGKFGARLTVWYRRDGGWIDRIDPTAPVPQDAVVAKNANWGDTIMMRLAGIWAVNDTWSVTPSIIYQDRNKGDVDNYWPQYSNPSSNSFVSANPTPRQAPDKFYLPSLKIQADFGKTVFISNTSYYHRQDETGYDGTIYNLGFYQTFNDNSIVNPFPPPQPLPLPGFQSFLTGPGYQWPLLDSHGIHLPASIANYRSPADVRNGQANFAQELRLQSNDPTSKWTWTTGLFGSWNTQTYLEQIHDPMLNAFWEGVAGVPYSAVFTDPNGNSILYDPRFPWDSYFLQTNSHDGQIAWFGDAAYAFTDQWKVDVGVRFSRTMFSFNTLTGGPQLFLATQSNADTKKENSFTPKVNVSYQYDPNNLYYFTYAKGFRPGGANNPVPEAACATDFANFGITSSPATYNSDTVDSFEVGAKNNFNNRVKLATSIYYIKWHNIQQTVVPPICAISWIQNLGQAEAKGGDIQMDVALSSGFSAQVAMGYTDARYTADAGFGPNFVLARDGDAVEGVSAQPAPAFTASVGLEYAFAVAEHESFVRADYEYQGKAKWLAPGQDPQTQQFDPANYVLPATNFVTLRGGTSFGNWQLQLFVDNLLDTHTVLNYAWSIPNAVTDVEFGGQNRNVRDYTFRPRTFGLTFIFRK